jgi:hypothetical protein
LLYLMQPHDNEERPQQPHEPDRVPVEPLPVMQALYEWGSMTDEIEFSQIGGVRFDMFNATWPFAKITLTRHMIELRCFSKKYTLEKNQIVGVREYNGILSKGFIIEHNRTDYPHHMVFWTFNLNNLKRHTEALGYSVGPPKKSDAWWRSGP